MTYDLLIRGDLPPGRLAAALAALVELPLDDVDVAGPGDVDRNWSAPVTATVEPLAGDLPWSVSVTLADSVARQPAEPEAAARLARYVNAVVGYSAQVDRPSAYWLVGPDGRRTRARVEELDGDDPGVRVDAVEQAVPAWPGLPIGPLPEVIREYRLPTPVADRLGEQLRPWLPAGLVGVTGAPVTWTAWTSLGAWEGMVERLAAGWPPDGWYPARFFAEDLRTRDRLAVLEPELPEPARGPFREALAEVDRRFAGHTVEDGGAGLAAALGREAPAPSPGWWWRRTTDPAPWRHEPFAHT